MDVPRGGREFAYFGWSGLPETPGTPQAIINGASHDLGWFAEAGPDLERICGQLGLQTADIVAGESGVARILIAGPEAPTPDPSGTLRLPSGYYLTVGQLVDDTEVIQRDGDSITVG